MAHDDDDWVVGPAKDVLDEKEKVEPQLQPEVEPEVQPQPLTPQRKLLRGLDVSTLIGLFQDGASGGAPWNDETSLYLLELIQEKGGPGAVRRAFGRMFATGDDRSEQPPDAGGSADAADDEDWGAAPPAGTEPGPATAERMELEELAGQLGRSFVLEALRASWAASRPPDGAAEEADRQALARDDGGWRVADGLATLREALGQPGHGQ